MSIVATTMTFAQLTEGHVAFEVTVESDDPEAAMAVSMFSGSTMNLYFSGDLARTELDFGALIAMTTVANNKTGEVLILLGGMMGNNAVLTSQDEMKEDSEEETPEVTVVLHKGKKKILGYKCKKATIVDENGEEMIYWYTADIKSQNPDVNSPANKIPGFPLEFQTNSGGMIMKFTATGVDKSLDQTTKDTKFSFEIPADYTEMTYEEFSGFGGM